jgi:hypothetical protein
MGNLLVLGFADYAKSLDLIRRSSIM